MHDPTFRLSHPALRHFTGLAALLLGLAGPAQAHDTWFELKLTQGDAGPVLALGTGDRYPLQETAVDTDYLRRAGCRAGGDSTVPLRLQRYAETASLFEGPAHGSAATCWAETTTFEIELPAEKVAVYLDEVRATAAQRQAWAAMQARGLPWKESYSKHARIELTGRSSAASAPAPADRSTAAVATGMAMDMLLQPASMPVRAGDQLVMQVLRDGAPLRDFNVELRSERSPVGLWLRTDGNGQVRVRAPAAGAWLMRGIDLRQSVVDPTRWDSRFVSLAFTVAPRQLVP